MNFSKNKWFEYLYLKDQKPIIFFIMASLVGSSYFGYITPGLIKDLYDSYTVTDSSDPDATYKAIYALGFLFLGEYFVAFIYQVSINRYVQKLLSFIRSKSYREWILSIETGGKQNFGDHKYPMGEVLSRILTDTEAVIEMVSTGSFKIFIDFTFIISCLIGFVKLNTVSGIALIIAEVFICILLVLGSRKMSVIYMAVRKSTGIMSRVIANLSGGFRFSFFHPHKNYASKKGYASFEDFLIRQLKANVWDASYFATAESLFPILLVLLVLIFPYGNITEMAVLAAIVDLIQRSIGPIKEIAGKISSIQRARTGIVRIEEFNDDLKSLPKSSFDLNDTKIELSKLELKVSRFEYPSQGGNNPFVLSDIQIEGGAGELIGIVGQSGCGKSTVLKILATDIVHNNAFIKLTCKTGHTLNFSGENQACLLYTSPSPRD